MKNRLTYTIFLFCTLIIFSSCESEAERKQREAKEEQQRIELEEQRKQEAAEIAFKKEQELKEKVIYSKYINNSLETGAVPYSYCFGRNNSCSNYGCSQIKVRTPSNSDVLVTIKKNGEVYRHAYIRAGSQYTFEFPNGTYQPFFYYGKGWNPEKVMKMTNCGALKGGFIADELFGKDNPQSLTNNVLQYELILQQSGNFSTRPSNSDEAF